MRRSLLPLCAVAAFVAGPALAQPPGMWGRPFGDPFGPSRWDAAPSQNGPDSREGKVDADRFIAEGARPRLGHGTVVVVSAPGDTAEASDRPAYEAAVIDQLVKAGYDTTTPNPSDGQIVELRIVRDTLVPEEAKHKPVSGETSVMVSNRGTAYGMALAVDLSKPKKALLSTRMEARIKDRASGATLWEGHASIATRDGDSHWNEQAIAVRLAGALFDGFPDKSTAVLAER